jgi:hypothetical protein
MNANNINKSVRDLHRSGRDLMFDKIRQRRNLHLVWWLSNELALTESQSASLENSIAEADNKEVDSDDVVEFLVDFTTGKNAAIDEETIKAHLKSLEETARQEIMSSTS